MRYLQKALLAVALLVCAIPLQETAGVDQRAHGQSCPGTNVYPFTANCPLPAASLNSAIAGRLLPDASNASLPDARNNILYTPVACDGFSATDGVISGSTLTSASASFTASDVGKPISVASVGPTQFFNSAVVVGGGAGHTVGEEIALTGGTGTAGSIVVRTVTGGAYATVAGKPGALGSYTVVPSNPVTAGDGTLTITWSRDNLVTTIASVESSNAVTLATTPSASGSSLRFAYGTDYSSQINAAIASSSKRASLPIGKCGIASTINIDSLQALRAQGIAGNQEAQTMFLWLGAVGGTAIRQDNGAAVNGTIVGPVGVDGNCAASTGLELRGTQWSRVDALVYNTKDYAFYLNMGDDGLADNYNNQFQFTAALLQPCARNSTGILLARANGLHDVNGSDFNFTQVLHQDGNGIDIEEGGFNSFNGMTQIFRPSPGNGYSLFFHGSDIDDTQIAKGNVLESALIQGGIYAQSGVFPSNRNRIVTLQRQPFFPTRTIEAGARLYCMTASGNNNLCTPYAATKVLSSNPTGTADTVSYKMMGLAGLFTPQFSGKMHLTAQGNLKNNNAGGGGGAIAVLRYGTGTPPANGDAQAGTACSGFAILTQAPSGTFVTPTYLSCDEHGFTVNTEYWYDVALLSVSAGTASIAQVVMAAHEWP